MPPWSFQPAPTPTSYSKQTSESMIRSAWSSNGRRPQKNSLLGMSRRRKLRQASRISTSRPTSSCRSSLTRRLVTRLASRRSLRSTQVRCRIRCLWSRGFRKRLWPRITSFSYSRMKSSQFCQCFVVRRLKSRAWKSCKKRSSLRWGASKRAMRRWGRTKKKNSSRVRKLSRNALRHTLLRKV